MNSNDLLSIEAGKDEVINLLKTIVSEDKNKNLYDHIQELFDIKLTLQNDAKFLDLFEDISYRLRKQGFYIPENNKEAVIKTYLEHFVKANQGKKTLLEPLVKKDGDEITPITSVGYVPDYYNIFQNLEWCNISISEKESYLLTNSLRTLVSDKSLPSVSFWGKIFGKDKDYYVVETAAVEGGEPLREPEPEQEARGTGLNTKTYFVANDLAGPWKELEDIRPSLLNASRKIKILFTGNLNKPIVTNPWFNGKESDLLRCQIARITQNITVIPNVNNYKVGAEPREIELQEDIPQPNINDCLQMKNWVHFLPGILKEGRTAHFERDPGEVDPDEFKKQIIANDPFDSRLKSIVDDSPIASPIPNLIIKSWKLSYSYDDKIYTNPHIIINPEDEESLKKDTSINNSIVHLRNLIWPGSHVIKLKGQIMYFYFGWGIKYNDDVVEDKFVFTSFPKIENENEDLPVGEEPNIPPNNEENNENVDGGSNNVM